MQARSPQTQEHELPGFWPDNGKILLDPKDFVDERQIIQMATFFGMKGTELKKVKLMASPK